MINLEEEKTIYARDIEDCDNCPLLNNDCPGCWTCGAGGIPIETPCCSWNGDEEIYVGMYDWDPRNYSDHSEAEAEYKRKKENEEKIARIARITELERQVDKYNATYVADINVGGELSELWLCPHCHNWTNTGGTAWIWRHGDIYTMRCRICGITMAHSHELDILKEDKI